MTDALVGLVGKIGKYFAGGYKRSDEDYFEGLRGEIEEYLESGDISRNLTELDTVVDNAIKKERDYLVIVPLLSNIALILFQVGKRIPDKDLRTKVLAEYTKYRTLVYKKIGRRTLGV